MPQLQWGTLPNVRDVGGNGGVPTGRIIRSPRLDELDDLDVLTRAGVTTVIDLRNSDEVRHIELPRGVTRIACPVERTDDIEFASKWAGRLDTPGYYGVAVARWPELFVAVFRAIADAPEGAVLVHCAGGRDRTGLIIAMLLQLAGVSHDDIVSDYATGVRTMNAHFARSSSPHEPPLDHAELETRVSVASGLLREFLAENDTETYLLAHGMIGAEINRVRARLAP